MKEELKVAYKNILRAVHTLEEEGYMMTVDGLSLLLIGDSKLNDLSGSEAFGFLSSLSSRKVKGRINYLVRYSYLKLDYNNELDTHFLVLTDKSRALNLKKVVKKDSNGDMNIYYLQKE